MKKFLKKFHFKPCKKWLTSLLAIFLLTIFIISSYADNAAPASLSEAEKTITVDDLKTHITYLASDELGGRDSGTKGCEQAAEYIRKHYVKYGLKPFGDKIEGKSERSFFQNFNIGGTATLAKNGNHLFINRGKEKDSFVAKSQFLPFSASANQEVKDKKIIFAGYGITNPEKGYDDYAGINVKDKIVVILRYDPAESTAETYQPTIHAYIRTKIKNALDHGAAGMIMVNGPNSKQAADDDPLFGLRGLGNIKNESGVLVHAKRDFLNKLLEGTDQNPSEIQSKIDKTKNPVSFEIRDKTLTLSTNLKRTEQLTANVIGVLEGSDPELKNEYIVFGGHYDHLGLGHTGSLGGKKARKQIHNGADDNASGTAAILEIAEAISQLNERPKRSIMFINFTAEEKGLIGSRYFVQNPSVPIESIKAMMNADMIGRYRKKIGLNIGGVGTSTPFKDILVDKKNENLDLVLNINQHGMAPSDQMSFIGKDIPALFYFTGLHKQYHSPQDDTETINFTDQKKICIHMLRTIQDLANFDGKFDFIKINPADRIRLGIMPDRESENAKVARVGPGTPAAKAGLKAGDVIVELAGTSVSTLNDLKKIISQQKKGNEVKIKITRQVDGQEVGKEMMVKF